MTSDASLWIATFAADTCPAGWRRVECIDLSQGIGGLLIALARQVDRPWAQPLASALTEGLADVMIEQDRVVPFPVHEQARLVAELLVERPEIDWDLAEWAEHVHSSARTLRRAFINETGLPFRRWRRRLRLHRSMQLLADGFPVGQAAAAAAYGSVETFIRAFKHEFGVVPSHYAERGRVETWPFEPGGWPNGQVSAAPVSLTPHGRTAEQGDDVISRQPIDRRTFFSGAAAVGVGWALAGCGSDDSPIGGTGTSTADSPVTTAELLSPTTVDGSGDFPRTVSHAGGTTELLARPSEIYVTRPGAELDAAMALGVMPSLVGTSREYLPWQLAAGAAEIPSLDL
ncbi:MAG: helix-turn-helix domain-containing protein, partial [Actinomycetota bacterium]